MKISTYIIATSIVSVVAFTIYRAVYPLDEFYKEEFEKITNIGFPENGKIVFKTATFPDQFGDYASTALIEVGNEFYNKLSVVLSDNDFEKIEKKIKRNELKKALNETDSRKINELYSKDFDTEYYYVAFLPDNLLIVYRASW